MKTEQTGAVVGFTAGPWITDDRHIHPASGLTYPRGVEPETDVIVLVDTDCHQNGLLNETDKANLRLIASAPCLLQACEQVLLASEDNGDMEDIDWTGLRAAVARAKGQP